VPGYRKEVVIDKQGVSSMYRRFAVLALCLAGVVFPSAAAHADNPVLVGTVGQNDAFTISLHDANGDPVRHLAPGTYTIQIHDKSAQHDFHLFGPGVDQATSVDAIVDVTWTVTFVEGTYNFQCDVHSNIMHGSFTVGTVAPPPPPPLALKASVGPGRTISLRNSDGSKVTSVTGPTQAVITVADRSKSDNFHLTGPGVRKATGVGFRGRVTWKVTLSPGTYVYRSDKHKKLHGSFTVASSERA
jgi:plastocyanin